MLTTDILNQDLNDKVSYFEYFAAFRYGLREEIFLRCFNDKDKTVPGRNMAVSLDNFNSALPTLRSRNQESNGIFYVVNGGGQSNREVKQARACFIDFDDFPFDEQIRRINDFPLEPSIIVKTRKSLHCYWLLDQGDIKAFRLLQERLIQYFGSDPSIKNESRVMRLYGFDHMKADPVRVTLIKFDPGIRYSQQQLSEVLPALDPSRVASSGRPMPAGSGRAAGEMVPKGQRHYYVVRRIGEFLARLKDSASDQTILSMIEADFYENCEDAAGVNMDQFRAKYLQTITKLRARHKEEEADPDFYRKAMKAWSEENPGKEFDADKQSWEEVKAAGLRAIDREESGERRPAQKTSANNRNDPALKYPVSASTVKESPEPSGAEVVASFLSAIRTEKYKPIPTGLKEIDRVLYGGFFRQWIIMLGAPPGTGKTTFVQWIVEEMAGRGLDCLYLNLEMSRDQMMAKSFSRIAARSGVEIPAAEVLQGYKWTAEQELAIMAAADYYAEKIAPRLKYKPDKLPGEGDRASGSDLTMIMNYLENETQKIKAAGRPAPVVVLDYLQLVTGEKHDDAVSTIKATISELKLFAIHHETSVIIITANNRESNKTGVSGLSSGRDTSGIEYGADLLLGLDFTKCLDKSKTYDELTADDRRFLTFKIIKSRFSESDAKVNLVYNGKVSEFSIAGSDSGSGEWKSIGSDWNQIGRKKK